jgi:hypothetical protein
MSRIALPHGTGDSKGTHQKIGELKLEAILPNFLSYKYDWGNEIMDATFLASLDPKQQMSPALFCSRPGMHSKIHKESICWWERRSNPEDRAVFRKKGSPKTPYKTAVSASLNYQTIKRPYGQSRV